MIYFLVLIITTCLSACRQKMPGPSILNKINRSDPNKPGTPNYARQVRVAKNIIAIYKLLMAGTPCNVKEQTWPYNNPVVITRKFEKFLVDVGIRKSGRQKASILKAQEIMETKKKEGTLKVRDLKISWKLEGLYRDWDRLGKAIVSLLEVSFCA